MENFLNGLKDFFIGPKIPRDNYLYQAPHIIALISVIVLTVLVVILFSKKSTKTKRTVLWIFASILIFFEITSRVVHFVKGGQFFSESVIPMHLCSISVWVLIISVIANNKNLYSLSVLSGLISTVAFLLYPSVGFDAEVFKFSQYYSIISHCIGFTTTIFLIFGGFTNFKVKTMKYGAIYLLANYAYAFLLNYLIKPGSNYMYYRENLLPVPYPVWITFYLTILVIYFISFYLKDIIKTLKSKRHKKTK